MSEPPRAKPKAQQGMRGAAEQKVSYCRQNCVAGCRRRESWRELIVMLYVWLASLC